VAPEVVHLKDGRRSYDEKCDVWSLGVMLYYLLCGYLPFLDDNTTGKTPEPVLSFPQEDPQWENKDWAKELITKMLNPDPRERISVSEALEHRWIVYHRENNNQ